MRMCGAGIWGLFVALTVSLSASALRADYIHLSVPIDGSVVPQRDPAIQPSSTSDANTPHLSVGSDEGSAEPAEDHPRPTVPPSKLKAEAPAANSGSSVEKPSNESTATVRPLVLEPVHIESVPEPSSIAMLVLVSGGLLLRRRRR